MKSLCVRRNQKYSNIPAEKVYFLGRYNKPNATPAAANGIKFLTASVFCNKVGCVKKVSSHPLKTCRSHFNAEKGAPGLSSEVATSGWRDGRQTWRDLLAKANQKT